MICIRAYKLENHKCGVNGCIIKKGKTCIYIILKHGNCKINYY